MFIVHILKTLVLYFVLMFLSKNVLGVFVRALFIHSEFDKLKAEADERDAADVVKKEIKKDKLAAEWTILTGFLGIIGYLYATFHFWNIGVTCIALILMFIRLPSLLWEIKTGKKITGSVLMSKNALLSFLLFVTFLALYYLLYYFLYHF